MTQSQDVPKIKRTADPYRNHAFQEQEKKWIKKIEFYFNRQVFVSFRPHGEHPTRENSEIAVSVSIHIPESLSN